VIWGVEDSTVLGLAGIIAGLGTALMSFWWNYKTRALGHREFLYQKQIEAYVDLSTNISRSLYPCYNFLLTKDLTPENRKELVEITQKAHDELWGIERMSLMILPLDVVEAVNKLQLVLAREIPKLDSSKQAGSVLTRAELDVCVSVRKWAGVEPLTKDMLQAFGRHSR
jgi:hypothetical protein